MVQIYKTVTVDVDVDINVDDFYLDDLIDILEKFHGYTAIPEYEYQFLKKNSLTDEQLDYIVSLVADAKPGTIGRQIYDKVRK